MRAAPRDRPAQRAGLGGALAAGVCILLLASPPALGLDPQKAITQYVHESWGIEDGLPQVTARSLVQTPDGYLWFGTQEGLVRFDGARFTVFDPDNTPGLVGRGVNALQVDRDGTLWIGRDFGLSRLKDGEVTPVDLSPGVERLQPDGVGRQDASHLLHDRSGNLWIAVPDGLLRYRDGDFDGHDRATGLADDLVHTVLEDRASRLWIGTASGLTRIEGGRLTSFTSRDGLPGNHVTALAEDREGSLWIGTTNGLARLREGVLEAFPEGARLPSPRVQALHEDRDGNLWVGTHPSGLVRLRRGRVTAVLPRGGPSDGGILSFLEDREGSLWIGTQTGGLHRLRDGAFTPFGTAEGLSSDMVTGLWEGPDGSLWIGASGAGVDRLKDGTVTSFTTEDGLPADDVSSLAGAGDGGLWVGTLSGGLSRLRDGKATRVTTRQGLTGESVRALLEDRRGVLWVGTNVGLTRVTAGEGRRLGPEAGLLHRVAISLAEDRDGTLWVGTSRGVNRLRGDRVLPPGPEAALVGRSIFSLRAGADGTLWVGSLSDGLAWLRGDRLTTLTVADGLWNGTLLGILEDGAGDLWMSCNKGIFRIARRELDAFAAGRVDHVTSVAYGVPDGMRSPECNRGGALRTRDGRLWFSTVRGLVVVDPDRLPKNAVPPTVVIEELVADGRRTVLPSRASLRLRPGTEAVELHYTATSLRVPSRVRFRYRLEGYADEWVEADSRRTAYFTRLPPDTYTFRVVAANDDGVWNEAGARLSFTVEPRPWQTGWFRALEAVAALGLLGVLFLAQRRRLDRRRLAELRLADLARKTEELEYARRVQLSLLPKEPWRSGPYEAAGESRPATEVGGDYYGYFAAGPGRFMVVIGDATGHGVAAGLVAGMVKAVLSGLQLSGRGGDAAGWLRELNGALKVSVTQRGLGMCLGLAHVDEATGRVDVAIAGVPHSFHWRAGREGGRLERLALSGPPLGYFKKIAPATAELVLAPGDRLVLLTDGLVEQRDRRGEMWGYEGVEAALAPLCARDLPPRAIAAALLDACEAFAAGRALDDDRTVVVLARRIG